MSQVLSRSTLLQSQWLLESKPLNPCAPKPETLNPPYLEPSPCSEVVYAVHKLAGCRGVPRAQKSSGFAEWVSWALEDYTLIRLYFNPLLVLGSYCSYLYQFRILFSFSRVYSKEGFQGFRA